GVFGSQFHRHSGSDGDIDDLFIDTLRVHVDLDGSACFGKSLEYFFPEVVAAFRYPALAVHPHRDPLDLGALSEDNRERIAAVQSVILGCYSLDAVVGIW